MRHTATYKIIVSSIERIFAYRLSAYFLMFFITLYPARSILGWYPHVFVVAFWFSVLVMYAFLLNKVTDMQEDAINFASGPIRGREKRITLLAALFAVIVSLGYFTFFDRAYISYAVLFSILAFFYSYRISIGTNRFRLKDVLIVKNATAAIMGLLPPVAVICVVYPHTSLDGVLVAGVALFSILFAFECMWDVRDMRGDSAVGVQTIPNTFGIRVTQGVAAGMLGVYLYATLQTGIIPIPIMFAWIASCFYVYWLDSSRKAWFYQSMIFVWVLALLFSLL